MLCQMWNGQDFTQGYMNLSSHGVVNETYANTFMFFNIAAILTYVFVLNYALEVCKYNIMHVESMFALSVKLKRAIKCIVLPADFISKK